MCKNVLLKYILIEELCCKNRKVLDKYRKRKTQKHQIKYVLLPIAWDPDRVYDWCFDGEEKSFLEEKTKKWCKLDSENV